MSTEDQTQQPQHEQDQQPARASSKAWGEKQGPERPLNWYEAKQEAKRERLKASAERARGKGRALLDDVRERADLIPFGQPILVGHHSERADRKFRAKLHTDTGKAFATLEHADALDARADAVGTGGVSGDDPDALDKLSAKLADLAERQRMMKAANGVLRKHVDPAERLAAVLAIGFGAEEAKRIVTPDFCGRVGFSYSLQNNNANMRRIKQRIETLQRVRAMDTTEKQGAFYVYREDADKNRLMFLFEGKPSAEVRTILKRHGFRWSPTRSAWVRQMTGNGRFAAQGARRALDAIAS